MADNMSGRALTILQIVILATFKGNAQYGMEILQATRALGYPTSNAGIYQNLLFLDRKGMVTMVHDRQKSPEEYDLPTGRQYYNITPLGTQTLQDTLDFFVGLAMSREAQ